MAGVEIPSDWTGEEKVGGWAGEGRKMGGGLGFSILVDALLLPERVYNF